MRFLIDDLEYRIQFQHLRHQPPLTALQIDAQREKAVRVEKVLGVKNQRALPKPGRWRREPALLPHPTLRAITLATIVVINRHHDVQREVDVTVAQGIALCSTEDGFNKEAGRMVALHRAIESCPPLRKVAAQLILAYNQRRDTDLDQRRFTHA